MSKSVQMGDKVELTALQLVYLLDKAICEAINRIEDGEDFDTMEVATNVAVEYVKNRKEQQQ